MMDLSPLPTPLADVVVPSVLSNWRWLTMSVCLLVSLWSWLPSGYVAGRFRRFVSVVSGVLGILLLWWPTTPFPEISEQATFWTFAAVTIIASVATISTHSPVYSAIWFAVTLMGTAGLYFLQQAQFLSIATIAVYAGAIVVTFLFVLMLSQPGGHASYDRLSWGTWPRIGASLAATAFVLLVARTVEQFDQQGWTKQLELTQQLQLSLAEKYPEIQVRSFRWQQPPGAPARDAIVAVALPNGRTFSAEQQLAIRADAQHWLASVHATPAIGSVRLSVDDTLTPEHMARLGGRLFASQWVSIEGIGVLLTAALVGAIAITTRDKPIVDS